MLRSICLSLSLGVTVVFSLFSGVRAQPLSNNLAGGNVAEGLASVGSSYLFATVGASYWPNQ